MNIKNKIVLSSAVIGSLAFSLTAFAEMTTTTPTSTSSDISHEIQAINAVDLTISKGMFTSKQMLKSAQDNFTKEVSQLDTKQANLTKTLDGLSETKDITTARIELEQAKAKVEAAKKAALEAKTKADVEKARKVVKNANKKTDTIAKKVKKLSKNKTIKPKDTTPTVPKPSVQKELTN